jgi:putative ABC transport system permease protein
MPRLYYRLLLLSYPARFRQRFGHEVLFALERGFRATWSRGAWTGLSFLAISTLDAVTNGLRERRSHRWYVEQQRKDPLMTSLMADIKYGLRMLVRNPGFAGLAIATLALGAGLTAAIFSVAWDALQRPLPFRDELRVVTLWEYAPSKDNLHGAATPANFLDWRSRSHTFSHMGALAPYSAIVATDSETARVDGRRVTGEVFAALDVEPLLGRTIEPADQRPANGVVVLGHRVWQQQFGSDPAIIGKSVTINEARRQVIGVLRPDFLLPGGQDAVFVPWLFNDFELRARKSHYVNVVARMKGDVSLEQAQADMRVVADGLAKEYPDANLGESVLVEPIRLSLIGDIRPALLMLTGAVSLVLLIACVNVANLLLAKAAARRQEFAVRTALGAGRLRLLKQLLAESAILALLAGGLGFVIAYWTVAALGEVLPATLTRSGPIALNPRVAAAGAAISALTGLLFGLTPALQFWTENVMRSMRENRVAASRSAALIRRVLVTAQIALALVLLVGAGLLMRSFVRLMRVDPGFRPEQLLTMRLELPRVRYQGPREWQPFYDRVIDELNAVPGVTSAAAISWLPLASDGGSNAVFVEGRDLPGPNEEKYAIYRLVTPGYFKTIGIPIVEGRDFTSEDRVGGLRVGAINQTLAARLWPGEHAIGKRLTFARAPKPEDWITIVAIVGDTHHASLAEPIDIELYSPYTQDPYWFPPSDLVLRTTGEPTAIASTVRQRLRAIDPLVPISDVQSMESVIAKAVAEPRFHFLLMTALSVSALILAAVGIYGLLAFSVALRSREIGVRTALGATSVDIVRMVLGEGLRLTVGGIVLGLVAAFIATRSLRTLLFQVEPSDPLTFASIAGLLLFVSVVACYVPARRAARVDPVRVLRD